MGPPEYEPRYLAGIVLSRPMNSAARLNPVRASQRSSARLSSMNGGECRGSSHLLLLPQPKGRRQPHDQQGQVAMHDHRRLGSFGKGQEVPGMLAFFENAIFNHTAPVIGVKYRERITYLSIG